MLIAELGDGERIPPSCEADASAPGPIWRQRFVLFGAWMVRHAAEKRAATVQAALRQILRSIVVSRQAGEARNAAKIATPEAALRDAHV
jgi:hypothetical protein